MLIIDKIDSFNPLIAKKITFRPQNIGHIIKTIKVQIKELDEYREIYAYNVSIDGSGFHFTIPALTLEEDKKYKIRVSAIDYLDETNGYTWSEWYTFNTVSPPVVGFTPIRNNIIYNKTFDLGITYLQSKNDLLTEVQYFINENVYHYSGRLKPESRVFTYDPIRVPTILSKGGWIEITEMPFDLFHVNLTRCGGDTIDINIPITNKIEDVFELSLILAEELKRNGFDFEIKENMRNRVYVKTNDQVCYVNISSPHAETANLEMDIPTQSIEDLEDFVWYSAAVKIKTKNGYEQFFLSEPFTLGYRMNDFIVKLDLYNNDSKGSVDIYGSQVFFKKTDDNEYPEKIFLRKREVKEKSVLQEAIDDIAVEITQEENDKYDLQELAVLREKRKQEQINMLKEFTADQGKTFGEWVDVAVIEDWDWTEYNVDGYNKGKIYVSDYGVRNGTLYEYALFSSTGGVVEIADNHGETTIRTDFEGAFLSTTDENYRMALNTEISSANTNMGVAQMTPLNSSTPIVIHGANNYKTFTQSFVPVYEDGAYAGKVSIPLQQQLIRGFKDFIGNGKPKFYRNIHGDLFVVDLAGEVSEETMVDGIVKLTFPLVEIEKINSNNLMRAGLVYLKEHGNLNVFPDSFYG